MSSDGSAATSTAATTPVAGVAVLTLSPALDLTLEVGELSPGRSHRAAPAAEVLGGKGMNVASVLAALGVPVTAYGPVNEDHWPGASSSDEGPLAGPGGPGGPGEPGPVWDLTPTPSPLRRSIAVIEGSGRATLVNESAHPHPPEVWAQLFTTVTDRLNDPAVRVLVVAGSTPADCPPGLVPELIDSAHTAGVTVIVDTSGQALLAAAAAGADWVKPNDEELAELFSGDAAATAAPPAATTATDATATAATATDDPSRAGVRADASRLIGRGARHVLLSRGSEGMVLLDETGPRGRARLDEALTGNPTGAGDAVVAALAACLAGRPDPRARLGEDEVVEILTRAVAVSAAAVLMPQAGQIHPDWRALRERVHVDDHLGDHPPTDSERTGDTP
ncbi:PfkB family carbohydrate kinase [Brevibacterium ammoniilyticum]|uniref:PfkB family carbohydrate kinase n=1 Tax=Brevibacterium ammoniilyticum TaxID=1046555 RepID=UPI0031398A3F